MLSPKKFLDIPVDATIFVAPSGDDTFNDGSFSRPYATLQAAVAAYALLPAGNYVIDLAPGSYGGAPIAWPVQLNKSVTVQGAGAATSITAVITYTSLGLSDENFTMNQVGVANQITFDLALAGVANITLLNGGYQIKRIDTLPPGPQVIRVFDSTTDNFDISGTCLLNNCQFVGGGTNIVQPAGFLLMNGCLFASMTAQVDGTLLMLSCLTQGTALTGAGTVAADATSLNTLTVTGPTVSFYDTADHVGYSPAVPADWAVVPDDVAEALDELAASAAVVSETAFVFKPGGVAGNGVYTTWASLYAALSTVKVPRTVYFDDTIVSPCVIPAGAYDLTNVTLSCVVSLLDGASVQVADGVTFTGFQTVSGIFMEFLNTSTVETISSPRVISVIDASIFANGTAEPFIVNSASVAFILDVLGSVGGGIFPMIHVNAGFLSGFNLFGGAIVPNDTVTGPGTASLNNNIWDSSATFGTQTGFTGAITNNIDELAYQVSYSPAVPADWAVPPTQVAQALDELAAAAAASVPGKELFVLSPADIAAKKVDLAVLVNHDSVIVTVVGAGGLVDTIDYSITDAVVSSIDWTGLGLDGVLVAGNIMQVQYLS